MAANKTQSEAARLDGIARHSVYGVGANAAMVRYSFEVVRRFVRPGAILELGPAEGIMTERLAELGQPLTVVDGSRRFCDQLRRRLPQADVVCSLFEQYRPRRRFTTIVLGHVLEHVAAPGALIRRAARWLEPEGRIFAAVPNCRSVHRQAAVLMGLLRDEQAMSQLDRRHGHRRVFSPESLRRQFAVPELELELFGGYWLKPLSIRQIEESWTPEMLGAFMRLGERYPDIAAEIYVVARRARPAGRPR
jgi:2-polyprenyl-3-methyl-5-hydroxy-6-metoxy-1,4-benzoquinol methylase